MKIPKICISVFVCFLIWSIATTCNAALVYETILQQSESPDMIKSAAEFKIRPIDFTAINALKDLGYRDDEQWNYELGQAIKTFTEAFPAILKESGMANKNATVIGKDEPVNSGILVEVAVRQIMLKYDFVSTRGDEYLFTVIFKNATDGQKLYVGKAMVTTKPGAPGNTNPMGSYATISARARFNYAAHNIAWVITRIMANGKIDPAKGYSVDQ